MNYIQSRQIYLEAIKDVLTKKQLDRAKQIWGVSLLDYDRTPVSNAIDLGKWELDKSDKTQVLNSFYNTDLDYIHGKLSTISDDFWKNIVSNIDTKNVSQIVNKLINPLDKCDWINPTFLQIALLFCTCIKKINIGETKNTDVVLKDDKGMPLLDTDGKIQKRQKTEEEKSKIYYATSAYNIISFANDWDSLFGTQYNKIFRSEFFVNLYSLYSSGITEDMDLFSDESVYLSITDHPSDVLNMSVSKYFTSCQELYTGGGNGTSYIKGLLYNLFDANTVPAFLYFNTPYIVNKEEVSDKILLSRLLIRNMTNDDGESLGLYFDKSYPDRMLTILISMIHKYTKNKHQPELRGTDYLFTPDIEPKTIVQYPYHDTLTIKHKMKLLGVNTKDLNINTDLSIYKIAKDNNVENIIIDNVNVPSNFFTTAFTKLKNITVNYIKIGDIKPFNNIIENHKMIFHKCYLYPLFFSDINPNLQHISLIGCYGINFDGIEKINCIKMTLRYSKIDNFDNILSNNNLKELEITTDINKNYKTTIDKLKSNGVKVTIGGLNI